LRDGRPWSPWTHVSREKCTLLVISPVIGSCMLHVRGQWASCLAFVQHGQRWECSAHARICVDAHAARAHAATYPRRDCTWAYPCTTIAVRRNHAMEHKRDSRSHKSHSHQTLVRWTHAHTLTPSTHTDSRQPRPSPPPSTHRASARQKSDESLESIGERGSEHSLRSRAAHVHKIFSSRPIYPHLNPPPFCQKLT
jgi:hypothetical protein